MRSPENVLESLKSKACNQSYKYERLYRNLYNPQFYLLAYQRIQAKPGNMTAGTDGKTIDGMGMARITLSLKTCGISAISLTQQGERIFRNPMEKCALWEYRHLTTN